MTNDQIFKRALNESDQQIFNLINQELKRQQQQIELIASENIVSKAVLEAQGSILTNKYAEGYPAKRYYGGCLIVDQIEELAKSRAKQLFNCNFVNVQPHSGSQANQAVMLALLKPNDTILGMSLEAGGHLTHGSPVNLSGKWFNVVQYGVKKQDSLIDYDQLAELAYKHRPKLIIAGGSAYPRIIDFERFSQIAKATGAYLMVDMAHFAGLVAAGLYPNPISYADVVTSTTHKTLRGPRGGIILTNNEKIAKLIDSAIFPGLQGGPLMHVIAAKAVALGEALDQDFKIYSNSVIDNAKTLAKVLKDNNFNITTAGTDTHLILVDLRNKNLTGKIAEQSLERAGLTCNKNSVPFDHQTPFITSGIRLGTPAGTSRGFKAKEFALIGQLITKVLTSINQVDNLQIEQQVQKEVSKLCNEFPIY